MLSILTIICGIRLSNLAQNRVMSCDSTTNGTLLFCHSVPLSKSFFAQLSCNFRHYKILFSCILFLAMSANCCKSISFLPVFCLSHYFFPACFPVAAKCLKAFSFSLDILFLLLFDAGFHCPHPDKRGGVQFPAHAAIKARPLKAVRCLPFLFSL